MLTISSFNPRQTLSAMLAANEADTKFLGIIQGTNQDSAANSSEGVMVVTQGADTNIIGIDVYPLYVSNTVTDSLSLRRLPNLINRVFYFNKNGSLYSHVRFHESWAGSDNSWTVAMNPLALSLPDREFESNPAEPNQVLFSGQTCLYNKVAGNESFGVVDVADIPAHDDVIQNGNRIQLRIMSSPVSNEFRLHYDVYSVDYQYGNVPYTQWVFYINSKENCFTRIIMEDAVVVDLDPATGAVSKRTDRLDAVRADARPRTQQTAVGLSVISGPGQINKYVDIVATLSAVGEGMPTASGWVTFYDGETELGTAPVVNGTAEISVIWKAAGSYSMTGIYSGDGVVAEAVVSEPLIVEIN